MEKVNYMKTGPNKFNSQHQQDWR